MDCPVCGGPTWDNREKKRTGQFSPKSPDYSCKDKSCNGRIWPPKDQPVSMKEYDDQLSAYDRAKATADALAHRAPVATVPVSNDERSRRIERQHSQEMAIRFMSLYGNAESMDIIQAKEAIKELTDWFEQDLNQS